MFRALICPSSGVCDYVVELPHWLVLFLDCCVLELGCGSVGVVSGLPAASAGSQCGSSTTWSQTPEDGHINARNMLSI